MARVETGCELSGRGCQFQSTPLSIAASEVRPVSAIAISSSVCRISTILFTPVEPSHFWSALVRYAV